MIDYFMYFLAIIIACFLIYALFFSHGKYDSFSKIIEREAEENKIIKKEKEAEIAERIAKLEASLLMFGRLCTDTEFIKKMIKEYVEETRNEKRDRT